MNRLSSAVTEMFIRENFFEVADDKHVFYNGELWSLSALSKHLIDRNGEVAGPRYFKYKGEWLNDIRTRLGK